MTYRLRALYLAHFSEKQGDAKFDLELANTQTLQKKFQSYTYHIPCTSLKVFS